VIAIFHSIFRFRIFLGINRPIALRMWSTTKLFVASRPIPKGSMPPFLFRGGRHQKANAVSLSL